MDMKVRIENQQKKILLHPRQIRQAVNSIQKHENLSLVDLTVIFVTERKIKSLNRQFLHRSYPTDVLAFDLTPEGLSYQKTKRPVRRISGEIYISTPEACRNAAVYQNPVEREIILYVIHGILHLLGYDDHTQKDQAAMRAKEQQLLKVVTGKK